MVKQPSVSLKDGQEATTGQQRDHKELSKRSTAKILLLLRPFQAVHSRIPMPVYFKDMFSWVACKIQSHAYGENVVMILWFS